MAHGQRAIEAWTRASGEGWDRTLYVAGDKAKIDAIGAALDVDAVYEDARERD